MSHKNRIKIFLFTGFDPLLSALFCCWWCCCWCCCCCCCWWKPLPIDGPTLKCWWWWCCCCWWWWWWWCCCWCETGPGPPRPKRSWTENRPLRFWFVWLWFIWLLWFIVCGLWCCTWCGSWWYGWYGVCWGTPPPSIDGTFVCGTNSGASTDSLWLAAVTEREREN